MRRKLLVVSPFLARSGMERNLAYFFEHYPRHKFEIGFAYFEQLYPKTQTSPLQESLTKISKHWHLKLPGRLGVLEAGNQLARVIESWQPEVILGKEWFSACAAIFARSRLTIHATVHPKVVALMENNPHLTLSFINGERLPRTKKIIYKRLLKQCEAVVGVSRGVTQEVGRVFGIKRSQLSTIYNGVDLKLVREQQQLSPAHPWLKPNLDHVSGIPIIVTCARLSPEKDLETLIRAVSLVNKERRVRCIILGQGKELPRLKKLSRELGVYANIDFHGYSENPFSFIARADVFVMTSLSEGFPSVLLEAMACGVPVIYTDCQFGPGEIIADKKNGLLVPIHDPKATAAAILTVLDNPDLAQKMVRTADQTIKSFTVQKNVQEWSRLLQQI